MPLAWLLLVWLVLISIFLIASLLSIWMNVRFGLLGFITYGSTLLFIAVTCLALFFVISYLVTVDWSQTVNPLAPVMAMFGS